MLNKYGAIQLLIFQLCDCNHGLFSVASCRFITLNLFCFILGTILCFFDSFIFIVITLQTIEIVKRFPLLFANAFKSVKERQLNGNQCRKEAINYTIHKMKQRNQEQHCYHKVGTALTLKGTM